MDWDDISNAALKMFRVWVGGGELEWAKECWGHFEKSGLAVEESWLEYNASLLRLVTLARIYEEFSGLAWDENPETPVGYLAEDLEIDSVALGILAARVLPEDLDDAREDYELREMALTAATNAQRKEIHACLCAAYGGEIALYSRMSRTHPTSDTDESDAEEFRVTAGNCQALEYVQNKFN